MKKIGITAHCLVRNEENWVWYAINSVLDYVDQILVFDTGSTDKTAEIIKSIKSPKIIFEQKGVVNKITFTTLRQEMLDRTQTAWFMVLDGDEVWPKVSIDELVRAVHTAPGHVDAIVAPQWVYEGDVFHYSREVEELQEDKTGRKGFLLSRAWRRISGLHAIGEYGVESYADKNGVNVSHWNTKRFKYINTKFFHMTFLQRSSSIARDREVMMRAPKTRFTKGVSFPKDFRYPEVFYKKRPAIVPSPWRRITWKDQIFGFYYRSANLINRLFTNRKI